MGKVVFKLYEENNNLVLEFVENDEIITISTPKNENDGKMKVTNKTRNITVYVPKTTTVTELKEILQKMREED